jgi:phosphonate degradation associated HDIG domain protein
MIIVDKILEVFATRGHEAYLGEQVSQVGHAVQAAYLARRVGAADSLVAAALLHDLGHLIHGLDEDIAQHGVDGKHELAGAAWLSKYFGPEVVEPIRLHVFAKRYLCSVDARYTAALSPASRHSLMLQGGPLLPSEICGFEMNPYFREAVALRRWDDAAKVVGMNVPGLESYGALLLQLSEGKGSSNAI